MNKPQNQPQSLIVKPPPTPSRHPQTNFNVSTNKQTYAATLNAVKTTTTFPEVLNLFLRSPSSPTSLKNCLFPCIRLNALTAKTPAP